MYSDKTGWGEFYMIHQAPSPRVKDLEDLYSCFYCLTEGDHVTWHGNTSTGETHLASTAEGNGKPVPPNFGRLTYCVEWDVKVYYTIPYLPTNAHMARYTAIKICMVSKLRVKFSGYIMHPMYSYSSSRLLPYTVSASGSTLQVGRIVVMLEWAVVVESRH